VEAIRSAAAAWVTDLHLVQALMGDWRSVESSHECWLNAEIQLGIHLDWCHGKRTSGEGVAFRTGGRIPDPGRAVVAGGG
jgi:hypothetical protein